MGPRVRISRQVSTHPYRIESRQNTRFKQWLRFALHPEEADCPWVPIEGWKNVEELSRKLPIELLLISEIAQDLASPLLARAQEVCLLPNRLLGLLSGVAAPQGIIAFFEKPSWAWRQVSDHVLYLFELQDPGNLGTLIRTAHATGFFTLITSPATVSCFNAKVIRASATALYGVPFLEGVALEELRQRRYKIWAAGPREGISLFDVVFSPPLAVVVGNEGRGWDGSAALMGKQLTIPTAPQAESLNASVAGSIILYEIFRQRALRGKNAFPTLRS
ncbi:MAG: RNA methyltransferase [Acidobacteria bacterium]|nr:RNA methyltransferase [Acidobacteriota bacterium]